MKNIIDIYEGILSVDDNLKASDARTLLYPAPTDKDFIYVQRPKVYFIDWYCKDIIQEYISTIKDRSFDHNRDLWNTIRVQFDEEGKYVMTKLAAKVSPDTINAVYTHLLKGVGLPSSSTAMTKKDVLEFFNHLSNNPDDIKKVFTYYNKCYRNEYDHGEYDSKPFNKILKY